MNKVKIAQK
jgi:hypothetical protein